MVSLPDGEKNFEDMFIRFDVIHERDRRTDRQTGRQTDRRTLHDSKDRACIASRGTDLRCCHPAEICAEAVRAGDRDRSISVTIHVMCHGDVTGDVDS